MAELKYPHIEVYQRTDKQWGWRLRAGNGLIIATDGNQGYTNESDAQSMVDRIVGGEFKAATRYRTPLAPPA